jgi:predicted RNase H-like HicB family nuclease
MKEMSYFAVFEPQPEGGYTVTFPDVPGAISEGEDFTEAWRNAREALELILEARVEAGEALPPPNGFTEIFAMVAYPNAIVQLVTAAAPTNAVRINVTMDEGLLERVDRRVDETGQSRSAFIAEAVRKSLKESA